jgi:hypothetical protein
MSATINFNGLGIGDRLTIRYPNGILQEAVLVAKGQGKFNLLFGEFVSDYVGPVVDIFVNGQGEWRLGTQ